MIISRTPYRVSFFGGGSDYPEYYLKYGGSVISTSIDKYSYILCKELPPYFEKTVRAVYSKTDVGNHINDITHPALRETLRYYNILNNIEVQHSGDLPARSGMGSSSAFVVGLINALSVLLKNDMSQYEISKDAFYIEKHILNEVVGHQDQVACACGGLNRINFYQNGEIEVHPLLQITEDMNKLEASLMLFHLKMPRIASEIAKTYVSEIWKHTKTIDKILNMVDRCSNCIKFRCEDIGELLDEYWQLKKQLSASISNGIIDNIYDTAKSAGATGGKLLGAGGGGMLLLYVPINKQEEVKYALKDYIHIPFKFEYTGSTIIYENED